MNKYNTISKRIGAAIIDGIIFLPFSLVDTLLDNNLFLLALVNVLYLISWSTYTILLHCTYGQTLGKKVMGIKLYGIDENKILSPKKAFFRESIWIAGQSIILIFFVIKLLKSSKTDENIFERYSDNAALLTIIWTAIELITMLFNSKKRSAQDFIANSVILKT
jgi:uncharacterized RDD family membrane protein YckC